MLLCIIKQLGGYYLEFVVDPEKYSADKLRRSNNIEHIIDIYIIKIKDDE